MNKMTTQQIAAAETKVLAAYYNHFTGKNIKKFSSRAAAIAQCEVYAAEESDPYDYKCPGCGATHEHGCITAAGQDGTVAGDERLFCHSCSTEWWAATGKLYKSPIKSTSRAASIAESWQDSEVAAERSVRTHVVVDGIEYRSVAAACKALHLPMNGHIKFRMDLKMAGKGTYNGKLFTTK